MPDLQNSFLPIVQLIQSSRNEAIRAVNTTLIELYWKIGQYISHPRLVQQDQRTLPFTPN